MTARVLIVPQAPGAVSAILRRLSHPALRFEAADDLDAAIGHLGRGGFEAVLLDVGGVPPDSSDRLRRLVAECDGVPVIVLTDLEDEEIGVAAVAAGAQDYLLKSKVNGEIVRRVIRYSQERLRTIREVDALSRQRRLILANISEGVLGVDAQGRVDFANDGARALLDWPSDGLLGHALAEVLPCAARDRACRDCLENGVASRRLAGGPVPLEIHCNTLAAGSRWDGMVVVVRDLSERVRHERQLESLVDERTRALYSSQHRLQAITDSLFEGVLVIRPDGRITFANPAAEVLLGQEGSPVGRHVDDVLRLQEDGEVLTFDQGALWRTLRDGAVLREDDAVFQVGAVRRTVAYAASPLIEDGRRSGVILSFRDIGDIKRALQDAFQASKLASVGQLAAGIAHEINTPIQYIGDNLRFVGEAVAAVSGIVTRALGGTTDAGLLALAEEADLDYMLGEMPSAVAQSLEGVDHISRIVLAMRAFSHPSGQERTAMDLNRAVETAVAVTRNEWKHAARLDLDLAPGLLTVVAAPGEINQVLLNLVVNAAHAVEAAARGEGGRILIRTRRQDGWMEVAVADNGTGIPESARSRIFDPFFTTKEVGRGTGQGLAICHDIVVAKHGGRIQVESEEGRGTTFTVALPLVPPDGGPH